MRIWPVLVDYWAPWCGPCKMVAPIPEQLAGEYEGKLTIAKINIDDNPETPKKYGVRGIPTLSVFKNGNVEATKVGALSKSQLTAPGQHAVISGHLCNPVNWPGGYCQPPIVAPVRVVDSRTSFKSAPPFSKSFGTSGYLFIPDGPLGLRARFRNNRFHNNCGTWCILSFIKTKTDRQ